MQRMSGIQNGYDMAHLDKLEFKILIVSVIKCLNGADDNCRLCVFSASH